MLKFFFQTLFFFIIICFGENLYAQIIDTTFKTPSDLIKKDSVLKVSIKNDSLTSIAIEDSTIIKVMGLDSSLVEDQLPSEFIFRIDYFNKTLSAGRDLGVNQFSVIPSITYYHKTGFYTGVSGNWYSQTYPNYSLTDLTAGYSNLLGKSGNTSYSLSYDHFFFNPSDGGVLTNALGIYGNYDFGPVNVGLNYSYLFGNKENGNKLSPSVGAYIKIKNVWFIDKITIMPNISATIGTNNLPFSVFNKNTFEKNNGDYNTKDILKAFQDQYPIDFKEWRKEKKIKPALKLKDYLVNNNIDVKLPDFKEFGLMSWNLSIPIKFTINNIKIGITYNYVIPVQLPHENFDLNNQSYFSANISYLLEMKPGRKKIK